jgi:acyl-[acyl-carrier-protein]-phospholipid O-acyltransferase / long-chain-fatty-acid--[acyl-carrier-protein] ligase
VGDVTMDAGRARNGFSAVAGAFFLGVYNDNYFKQAILLLAVAAGMTSLQGVAVMVFTLPFLVLAAPAGWAADRFSKRNVIVAAKAIEVLAMIAGAIGIATGAWWLSLVMLGAMGSQATFMSPAVNGAIPELFPESRVTRANGILRMVVTVGILVGIALAGVTLDLRGAAILGLERGRLGVGVCVVLMALAGLAVSLRIRSMKAARPGAPFPWLGPWHTLRDLAGLRRDPILAFTVCASVFIWTMGSLQVLLINPLGTLELGLSKSLTSGLIVVQLAGIAVGGLVSPWLARGPRWHRVLAPSGMLMGAAMLAMPATRFLPPVQEIRAIFGLMAVAGFSGGVFLIPVESFIQTRSDPDRRGAILAAANFAVFGGILASGAVSNFLNARWAPTTDMGIVGAMALVLSAGGGLLLGRTSWA